MKESFWIYLLYLETLYLQVCVLLVASIKAIPSLLVVAQHVSCLQHSLHHRTKPFAMLSLQRRT